MASTNPNPSSDPSHSAWRGAGGRTSGTWDGQVINLANMPYQAAAQIQLDRHDAVVTGSQPEAIFTVEHPPVLTISQRKSAAGNILASPDQLGALGIDIQPTDRGGDITYHGPGQAVIYPIIRLSRYGLNLSTYMHLLETCVQEYLASLGLQTFTDPKAIGVWVEGCEGRARKVCALGVRITRNVTQHGLALNVSPDMSHFKTIVPCGLHDRAVTRLADLLTECPTVAQAHQGICQSLIRHLTSRLNAQPQSADQQQGSGHA